MGVDGEEGVEGLAFGFCRIPSHPLFTLYSSS